MKKCIQLRNAKKKKKLIYYQVPITVAFQSDSIRYSLFFLSSHDIYLYKKNKKTNCIVDCNKNANTFCIPYVTYMYT